MARTTRRTPRARHARRALAGIGAAGLLLAACAPAEEDTNDVDGEQEVEEEWEEETDPESQAGDDLADADGILLAVDPACAEIGDGFTVNADGLEPDTNHTLMIEPEPSATGAFEAGVVATSDGDGALEASANLDEDADIQPGEYEIELYTAEEGDAGEWLISTDLEIAETCEL